LPAVPSALPAAARQGRVAVLLGTVQFHLKVNVVVPENATLKDAEKAALAAIEGDPIRIARWSTN
jgi:hypothetical protein